MDVNDEILFELKKGVEKYGLEYIEDLQDFERLYPKDKKARYTEFDTFALVMYKHEVFSFFKWAEELYRAYRHQFELLGPVVAIEERSSPFLDDNAILLTIFVDISDDDLLDMARKLYPISDDDLLDMARDIYPFYHFRKLYLFWRFRKDIDILLERDTKLTLDDVFERRFEGFLHFGIRVKPKGKERVLYEYFFKLADREWLW